MYGARRMDVIGSLSTPFIANGYSPSVTKLGRRLVQLIAVIGCAVAGFIFGWSNFGSGGLEGFYRSALIGTVIGLVTGFLVAAVLGWVLRQGRSPAGKQWARPEE